MADRLFRLVERSADLLTGCVEVFIDFLAGVFGFGLDIVRDHFGVVPSLLGGLAGLFAGVLILRRRAGPKGNGKGNNSG